MINKNFEVYLDFGSSKIRAGAFNKNNSINNFYYESDYYTDYLNSGSEIEKTILHIEKNTKEYLNDINLMLDSPESLAVGISLFKNFDGSKLKKKDIQFLIQEGKQQILSNYLNLNIVHIIIKNYKVDNIDYTLLPTDVICNLLSIDIIFICLPKKILEDLKTLFFKYDISINQIFCSSYAKSINYKDNFLSTESISFIDMGFNKTSITSYNNNEINFFHVLPIGGNHITKDLSKVLNIDLINAENIKLCFDKNENFIKDKEFSFDLVQKIIFARIEEILELCIKSIKLNSNFDDSPISKIVLMGEGSRILDNKFKEKISFSPEIDLLEESSEGICESALKLSKGLNKQEVVVVPRKQIKEGFFARLFHLFK
jgi:cell division protein FtsA